LGKVVLSNIRTPKMLMDVGGGSSSDSKGSDAAGQTNQQEQGGSAEVSKARPLDQEPMLAARIMVEDCMLLLCDVEDIDRMFAGAAAVQTAQAVGAPMNPHMPGPISPALAQGLLQRRAALLGGIAASFRLPSTPTVSAADGAAGAIAGASADRVFVRILALPKGRSLITKTLKLMFTPPPAAAGAASKVGSGSGPNGDAGSGSAASGLEVIFALLRNAQLTFGPALVGSVGEAEKRLTDATISLAVIASEMVKRLKRPEEAVACLAAAVAGLSAPVVPASDAAANGNTSACQLLPLYPAGRVPASASPEWLGNILGSLLLRASELGLGSFAAAAAAGPVRGLGDGAPDETAVALEQEGEAGGVPAAIAAEWQAQLGEFVQLVLLHLWQLVQALRGAATEVATAAAAGPGSSAVLLSCVPMMACVPLMRMLMAHVDTEQQEQLKGYLSEVGR
jgi:DNA topoisomerase 2-associated protein PAT1